MNTRVGFGLMIAGSVSLMVLAAWRRPEAAAPVQAPRAHERPWLTAAQAGQLVGSDNGPGPLFAGLTLGGTLPSPEQRAQIATFARLNNVDIELATDHDVLTAISVSVTFGGCCGYEGADSFSRRFARPRVEEGCGGPKTWIDDWAMSTEDGIHLRAHVHVNRVDLRWEPSVPASELYDRAEAMIGKPHGTSGPWTEIDRGHEYLVEIPFHYATDESMYWGSMPRLADRRDLGLHVLADSGKVTQVEFSEHVTDREDFEASLRKRWGRTHQIDDEHWEWHAHGHVFTADLAYYDRALITIK